MFWNSIKTSPSVISNPVVIKDYTYEQLRSLSKDNVAKLFHHHYCQLKKFNDLMAVRDFIAQASYDEDSSNYMKIKVGLENPTIIQKYNTDVNNGKVDTNMVDEFKNDLGLRMVNPFIRSPPPNLDDETNAILIGAIQLMKDTYKTKDF